MDRVISVIADLSDTRVGGGDSFCDRLNCRLTVFVLAILALGITTKQYLGDTPIACWCPSHFTDSHVDFTNKVCWTQDTYYLPITEERIPKNNKRKQYISYYQWVALVLTCQALLFYLPRPIWRLINKKSGIAVATITDAAIQCQRKMDPDDRDKTLRYMVKHMGRFLIELSRSHLLGSRAKGCLWSIYGNYLIISYIVLKLVYIFNVIAQIIWMNNFLSTDYHMYGFHVLWHMLKGESWTTSDRFPRVTMCDFSIRTVGNIQPYTVQCSLPLNLFNEKIFIFLWFWFAFVGLATVGSLVLWIATSFHLPQQCRYIRARLIAMDRLKRENEEKVDKFVRNYLRRDGLFIIRMVSKNSSDIIAAELIAGLWDHYKDNQRIVERLESRGDTRREVQRLVERQITEDAA